MDNDIQKTLQEILGQVQERKVALFIGAGVSHSVGGPTGEKLTEMIKEKFPKINQTLNNFIEVCQDSSYSYLTDACIMFQSNLDRNRDKKVLVEMLKKG